MSSVALDTNILIYLFDSHADRKRIIADRLILDEACVSPQVISEFINVAKRKLTLPKIEIITKCNALIALCTIIPFTHATLDHAKQLILKYDFQLFDSIIVASALQAHYAILRRHAT